MYFEDEKDLGKDDNFSLEDDGSSISWEDLLNSDEDIDLEKLVKKDAIADLKEDLKADNIEGIISETETPILNMDSADSEEPVLKNLDDFSNAAETNAQQPPLEEKETTLNEIPNEPDAEDNFKTEAEVKKEAEIEEKTFDIKTAAANYMNSLSSDDMNIKNEDSQPKVEETPLAADETPKEINLLDEEIKPENEISIDDIPTANDFVFEDNDNKEVMGALDDELLSMLDSNSDMSEFTDSSILNANDTDSIESIVQADDSDIQLVSDDEYNSDNISINEIQPDENFEDNKDEYIEDDMMSDDMQDEMPLPNKKKGFSPLLAACMLGLTAIIALAVYIFAFPKNQNEPAEVLAGGNEALTQPSLKEEVAVDNNADPDSISLEQAQESAKAQREELINKLEDSKAENKDKKDTKKVVVNITTTGRSNPFLPSLMFGKDGFAQVGTDLSSPPDETMMAPDATQVRKLFSITVSGIMYDPSKPSAIVRFDGMDYFVQKGDRINNYQITQITKDYVAIKSGVNTYKAFVGETFTTENVIDDINSVKTINGNRQYISTSDIEINKSGAGS